VAIIIHLAYRATQAGFETNPAGIFHGKRHGLSMTSRYQEALGDEPLRLSDVPIRSILATEPPEEFYELWARDIQRYHVLYQQPQESQL
jgi:hypothetical protein